MLIARSKYQSEAGNFLGLGKNSVNGVIRHALISGFEIPGFDTLQVLLETPGEAKRLCDAFCHVRRGGVRCPI